MGALNAYRLDTVRHILVSDKSRRVPGADDVRVWNCGGPRESDADYLAITPELQPDEMEVESKTVGKQDAG